MTEAVKKLLEEAKSLKVGDTEKKKELEDAILDVEALEDAKGTNAEVKDLKEIVEEIKSLEPREDEQIEETKPTDEQKEEIKSLEPKDYFGIKMIGSLYYSSKDGCTQGYSTAYDCALANKDK